MSLTGEKVYLKLLTVEDVNENYLEWINDEVITQYLECRWKQFTLDELKDFVKSVNSSGHNYLFGIYTKKGNEYIGNIKIGEVNSIHRYADVGLMIGNKNAWGKGYGSEAIKLVTNYAKNELNLNKLIAGIYENNTGSYKAFLKAGYQEVARFKKHRFYKGSYVDEIVVEIVM